MKEKVAAFVDDVLIETETKKGYNEIVKEVLKRLEENGLYIKEMYIESKKDRVLSSGYRT